MSAQSMGNLDWGSMFSLEISQNRGEGKKVYPADRNYLAFYQYIHFFDGIDQKLRRCKKCFF